MLIVGYFFVVMFCLTVYFLSQAQWFGWKVRYWSQPHLESSLKELESMIKILDSFDWQ